MSAEHMDISRGKNMWRHREKMDICKWRERLQSLLTLLLRHQPVELWEPISSTWLCQTEQRNTAKIFEYLSWDFLNTHQLFKNPWWLFSPKNPGLLLGRKRTQESNLLQVDAGFSLLPNGAVEDWYYIFECFLINCSKDNFRQLWYSGPISMSILFI
jgi:hypothetical protein